MLSAAQSLLSKVGAARRDTGKETNQMSWHPIRFISVALLQRMQPPHPPGSAITVGLSLDRGFSSPQLLQDASYVLVSTPGRGVQPATDLFCCRLADSQFVASPSLWRFRRHLGNFEKSKAFMVVKSSPRLLKSPYDCCCFPHA